MDNNCTRMVINNLTLLIDKTVVDDSDKALWLITVDNYKNAMTLLWKKEDFTNEEIADYQKYGNLFFVNWVKLQENAGVAVKLHSHDGFRTLCRVPFKWRNLYRYSQQGWEAMNTLINTVFF